MTDLAKLHNPEAEASVLGGILLRPELIRGLRLEADDFFAPRNRAVWGAIVNLDAAGAGIDGVTVEAEMRRLGTVDAVGGLAYLADLQLRVPHAEAVRDYAEIVIRYARRRAAVRELTDLRDEILRADAADGEDVVLEAIGRLQRLDLREPDPTRALGDSIRDELRAIRDDAIAEHEGRHVGGMPSGLTRLDAFTGGFPIGVVTLVLGETGHGKSTLAMQFMRAARELAGDRPVCFSYEDGHRSFAQRAIAQESGVPTQVIARRHFRGWEHRAVGEAGVAAIAARRERIAAWRGQTVEELCRTVRRLRARGPEAGAKSIARLTVVDYLQAIPKPWRRGISTPEAIGENAAALEDLAAREQIAIVVMSQVNDEPMRRVDDHRPQLRDVAGSRDPAKGCKLALGLYRPAMYDRAADPKAGELLILKNNQGQAGVVVDVQLDLATHTIRDAAGTEQSPHEQQRMGVA